MRPDTTSPLAAWQATAARGGAGQGVVGTGQALGGLKAQAARDPKAAINEAAKQFETLFMQEVMKSMRATTMNSGMLENGATDMARGMLDQQYATQMAGKPGGLSAVIAQQLQRQMGLQVQSQLNAQTQAAMGLGDDGAATAAAAGTSTASTTGLAARLQAALAPAGAAGAAGAVSGTRGRDGLSASAARAAGWSSPEAAATASAGTAAEPAPTGNAALDFVRRHRAAAEAASAETGIPANFILAQAALETGWGRKEIRPADGGNSFNLFGIKAGANWQGATARVTTTEVIDGQPQKVKADFRAYASYEEAFKDWARLLKDSPRYAKVVERGGDARQFAQGLQRAGYATDPAYADKLGRVINTTLRLQRMSA